MCNWTEPKLAHVDGVPLCTVEQPVQRQAAPGGIYTAPASSMFGELLLLPSRRTHAPPQKQAQQAQFGAAGLLLRAATAAAAHLFGGRLFRVASCELEYGPLNCDFEYRGTNGPVLDEALLPSVSEAHAS